MTGPAPRPQPARPTFVVTLQAAPGGRDPIHALRALLKYAGRYLGLRAVSVREVHQITCTGSGS